MVAVTFNKDPSEQLDFTIDYSAELDAVADSIASSAWTVESGITNSGTQNTGTTATLWLTGGTSGTSYKCTNQIITANSPPRKYVQVVVVGVKSK